MRDILCNKNRLLKTAFGYRNMSRKDIESAFAAEEKMIKKARAKSNAAGQQQATAAAIRGSDAGTDMRRRLYSMIGPLLKGNNNLVAETLAADTSSSSSRPTAASSWSNAFKSFRRPSSSTAVAAPPPTTPPQPASSGGGAKKWYLNASNQSHHSLLHYHNHHPQSTINLPVFSLENTGSAILAAQQLGQLWRWLPARYQILELELVYSTNIHGCRLMTLMDKCEFYNATILVVQTTNNSIFGAFCSQPWSKRISPDR